MILTRRNIRATATHEAGHAAAAYVLGMGAEIRELWVAKSWYLPLAGGAVGHLDAAEFANDSDRIVVALAGPASAAVEAAQPVRAAWDARGASGDMHVVKVLGRSLGPDALEELKRETEDIVRGHRFRQLVRVLADRLESGGRLSGDEVRGVLAARWKGFGVPDPGRPRSKGEVR